MQKIIVAINGDKEGKTLFTSVVRDTLKLWTWNINPYDVLTNSAYEDFGWDGKKNGNFYDFLTELSNLANKYFNFTNLFLETKVSRFIENPHAQVLFIHGCSKEAIENLRKSNTVISVHVDRETKEVMEDSNYNMVFVTSPNLASEVESYFKSLISVEEVKE